MTKLGSLKCSTWRHSAGDFDGVDSVSFGDYMVTWGWCDGLDLSLADPSLKCLLTIIASFSVAFIVVIRAWPIGSAAASVKSTLIV